MVRRVMKDAFVVWKNSRSIFGLTNYFAGQPRVAGAILSILFGLFLSACGGGGAGSPPIVPPPVTQPPPSVVMMDDLTLPIIVDAPVQGLHYRPVGPVTLISRSQKTDGRGGFNPGGYGTVAFAVGEITVVGEISVSDDSMTTVTVDNGDGLTLSQYKSNGFLGFIVHPVGEWQYGVFTPYDLRDKEGITVSASTVNVGAVARVLQGFDEPRPSTSPVGVDTDDESPLILIHPGATAERTVMFDQSDSGVFSVRELSGVSIVQADDDNYPIVISPQPDQYDGITLFFPLLTGAMETLSMVIADMADEISPFSDNSAITLKNGEARTGYFARRGSYSLDRGESDATINPNTGDLTYTPTHGEPPQSVVVTFRYGGDQIIRNQTVELDSLPRTDSENFQIYFTGGKPVALTLKETKGGNLPLRYELDPLSELKRYDLIFDHESGILSGTPQQEAFTVDVALDIYDSGGDDAKPSVPDLEFQIVSREGEPAYYEIDLRGGAGSFATLHFPDRDGNEVSEESTEESIAGIDSACQDGSAAGFGKTDCPYSADYIFGGAKHPEGLGDIPGVMVVVGLKSTGGGNTVCAGGTCPAGVKAFTISFQNENDGKPLSVNARVLLPRPAFDPASASENFATYIAGSPNPSRRPLPAADGGNGRLIYSVAPLPAGLTLHSATRRLLGRPTDAVSTDDVSHPLTMTVVDLNGGGASTVYHFTIVVQPDRKPAFARDAETAFTATLSVATTLTFSKISVGITLNRATIYSVGGNIPRGMMNFDPATRQLSGSPMDVGSFTIYHVATDPDEELDEDGNLITPMTLRVGDDDKATLTVVVFVDGEPTFGDQTVPVPAEGYIVNTRIAALTLPEATGGNGDLNYTLSIDSRSDLAGLDFDDDALVLSGTPTQAGDFTFRLTVTDSDDENPDSAGLSFAVNISGDESPDFGSESFADRNYIETWPIPPVTLPEVASDGNGETTYSIEGLPQGLSFNPATRELNGTPEVDGTFPITLIAHDSDGNDSDTGELKFDIIVASDIAPVLSDSVDDQDYIQNTQIMDLRLPEANSDSGNGALTYSLAPLPLGLSFNRNTRILSGRPEDAGVFQLTYTVTDSDPVDPDSDTDTFVLNITLDLVPSFAESVPQQNYFQGEAITMTLLPVASGGNGLPLTYRYDGLPEGITITLNSATRELTLSGTPTQPGSFVATIVAMDTDGNTDESDNGVLTFRIEVEEDTRPSFISQDVPLPSDPYPEGTRISPLLLPAATGGNGQLTYSVSNLPPGLRFTDNTQIDNTRVINQIPTSAGTYIVTYTVQDRDGDTLSFTFTIIVSAPSP